MAIATKSILFYFQEFAYEVGVPSILHTKHTCTMDHGDYGNASFEITKHTNDILWLNI